MARSINGGCLCGAVRYSGSADPVVAIKCYCTDCRKSSGTGHAAHLGVPKMGVAMSGKCTEHSCQADSGNTTTRGFCPTCGVCIYSANSAMPDVIFLRASSLDDVALFEPQISVYASRAPIWDPVSDKIPAFPAMPQGMP